MPPVLMCSCKQLMSHCGAAMPEAIKDLQLLCRHLLSRRIPEPMQYYLLLRLAACDRPTLHTSLDSLS